MALSAHSMPSVWMTIVSSTGSLLSTPLTVLVSDCTESADSNVLDGDDDSVCSQAAKETNMKAVRTIATKFFIT